MQLEKSAKNWRFRMFYIDENGIRKSLSKSRVNTKAEANPPSIEIENAFNKGVIENQNYLLD
ncbi:hypothetical protein [Staphylococcus delphini]|uniref:hypothetical protein n=1 Tax=Staphylococcus delphini TaxID=53344 RepID=UPI0012D2F3B9|nr:hypothetical protein [Staphylococcus delphini]MTV20519.1 hypothetical protein [Staphylococcus delphini]